LNRRTGRFTWRWRKRLAAFLKFETKESLLRASFASESWPIAGAFTIARGSKTTAEVVVVTLERAGAKGWGEAVPYARYGEQVAETIRSLESNRRGIEQLQDRRGIAALDLPQAARNALDCALWDLECKESGEPASQRAGLAAPRPVVTAYTISLGSPEVMHVAASAARERPLLKIKLGRDGDKERLLAVREAAPQARLIIDANEGWTSQTLEHMLQLCANQRVELVEQPLPADDDEALRTFNRAVPVCADESIHGVESLDQIIGKYDAINIKLDKTGGLTPALQLAHIARARGLRIMVGCMLATSLSMAPAHLLSAYADWVDLDGPLLLARDRIPSISYAGSVMQPPPRELWG
jgi:L-alanine-DL-glutamate epimerase-like enolase superfamily enzyme